MGVRSRSPIPGASQYGVTVDSSVDTASADLTVPDAAMVAEIYVRTSALVFTRDGTNPSSTAGFQADPTDMIMLRSRAELDGFEWTRESADGTFDIEYFTDISG